MKGRGIWIVLCLVVVVVVVGIVNITLHPSHDSSVQSQAATNTPDSDNILSVDAPLSSSKTSLTELYKEERSEVLSSLHNSLHTTTPELPRIINYSIAVSDSAASDGPVDFDDTSYQEYVAKATFKYKSLRGHIYKKQNLTVEQYMELLSKQSECAMKPIFMTMAMVSSDLYWQLIENFFHTMYYFGNVECVVMVCVSDPKCVALCESNNFPCFDFSYERPDAPTFEQVAAVKIRHVGLALKLGVNVMLLDLDVGFLRNPMILYEGFMENPYIQIICQMDIGWGQDKFKGMSWRLFPRTNFGLYIVKAHKRTIQVFERGWTLYQKMPEHNKNVVAKDQSIIHGAMQTIQWRYGEGKYIGLNFSYFFPGFMVDIQPNPIVYKEVLLLHKVEGYNDHGVRFELGGHVALEEVGTAVAAHATCYEKTSKLYALKAVNAFWNSAGYYMPSKKTLTKPLMIHESREQMLDELKALMYVAIKTKRSLIIPNILVGLGLDRPGGPKSGIKPFDYNLNAKDKKNYQDRPKTYEDITQQPMDIAPKMGNNLYWPAFRTVSHRVPEVEILEPGFYYKIENHLYLTVPEPSIIEWEIGGKRQKTLDDLVSFVESIHDPRLVLDIVLTSNKHSRTHLPGIGRPINMVRWAHHSASSWGPTTIDPRGYVRMPIFSRRKPAYKPKDAKVFSAISRNVKLCQHFLARPIGNRSCFNKCN